MVAARTNAPLTAIPIPLDKIADFCAQWRVTEFALFGSVLGNEFGSNSDVDVLVRFEPGVQYGFVAIGEMEDALSQIFGRRVDLLTRRGVELSDNKRRKREILDSAQVIHVRK